jgi:S-methylmethionine-dependent homocysteine/selenocysteine methylase
VLITTPTWRANHGRLNEFGIEKDVDGDAARFSLSLREKFNAHATKIFIGGLIGCKNDCYQSCEALSTDEAEKFHASQINQLAASNLDFLMAATLPSVAEATGIARAMSKTPLPYFISFVIDKNGLIFDGTDLESAFKHIDSMTRSRPPLGYLVNCAYPSFLHPGKLSVFVLERLKGFQGNASSKDHSELDGSSTSHRDSIEDWGERMIALNRSYGIPILGGCCGTRVQHLEYIIKGIQNPSIT